MNLIENIQSTLLMGPGPSCVHPATYHALSRPTLGHMDPYFISIMDEVKANLRLLFGTSNAMTIPVSGTGSAGMETAFVNLVEPGDAVLILINGVFGMRMADVAERLGAQTDILEFEWGTPVIPEAVEARLKMKKYKIIAVVHAETSTGVCNPVAEIGNMIDEDSLYIVDTVTSLGGIPVEIDRWKVDVTYSGSQKCLSCPPGVSPVSFSEKAMNALKKRDKKVPNWYLDINLLTKYWEGNSRVYHHTAPINMLYALYQSLRNILDEGKENVFKRHSDVHYALVNGLDEIGFKMLVKEQFRLPMLNAVVVPSGMNEVLVRSKLLNEFRIEIGAGLGPLAGKIIRIGLMGHTARTENVTRLLDALKAIL